MSISRITIESPFRVAMLKGASMQRNLGRYGAQLNAALKRDAGVRSVSSWNAHLSFRTAEKLKAQGYLP